MQRYISKPILALAAKAKAISDGGDYTIRATKLGDDELGLLTDAFNQMLDKVDIAQKQISELNRDLEKKVLLRTSELESINKELESFSYSVSHDLRAPIRIIGGFTNILISDYNAALGEDGNKIANVIVEQTKQMGQLIDDLLNFSRLGRASLKMQKVDTNHLVSSIIEQNFFAKQDPVPEIKMEVLPHITCDIGLMRQVWLNLISNAIKYSSKNGKAIIEIGSYTKDDQLVFFIKDNGVGFDMKYANKLFGAFQRLHKQEEFSGTGIGLAIVQRIINKHSGNVWAYAEVGKGATFYFSIPQSPLN
jgi:light-regulated signal transduction histidine kinase (bacteriophytochrome)